MKDLKLGLRFVRTVLPLVLLACVTMPTQAALKSTKVPRFDVVVRNAVNFLINARQ